MAKKSAGILLYRFKNEILELFLVHPGGPFWAKKDLGAWSIPKGEFSDEEEPFAAAVREFKEEVGDIIIGEFISLTPVKQKSGKIVHAFALEQDFDATKIRSNSFTMEWPPKSGKKQEFLEIDKADWFDYPTSKEKLNEYQAAFVEELIKKISLTDDQLKPIIKPSVQSNKPQPPQLDLFG